MKRVILGICLILLLTGLACTKDTKAAKTTKVEVLTKSSSSWDGSALPEYPKGTPEITIARITIPPKTKLPLHKHPVILGGVVLKGELTVVTEEKKTLHLKAGDPCVEVVNKWHYGKNDGNEPTVLIAFYVGIKGKPISIKKTVEK